MGIVNGVAQEVGCFFDGRMEHRTLEQSPVRTLVKRSPVPQVLKGRRRTGYSSKEAVVVS